MAIKIPIISEYDKRGQNDAETGLNKLGKSAKRLAKIGAAAFAAVGAGAVVMGKKLLDAGERAATSNARIEQITKSMGQFEGATDQVTDRLVTLAEKTAKLVGVDQNLIKEGQALLLTFKSVSADADKVGGVFDRATKAAIDLAAAGFGSVTTNSIQLGKALEDPIKGLAALGKSGVTFTAEQKELIKTLVETGRVAEAQEIILKAVETQVGGTAEATANASDRMKVAFSQLQESLGERLLPVFEKFATFFIDTLIPRMETLYNKAAPYVLDAFRRLSHFISTQHFQRFKHLLNT
jgi:phage-related minor tail protein